MKNNRFSKIIALLLSCLFIIGALTGLVVSAEEGTEPPVNEEEIPPVEEIPVPTATIKYKNVSYEGAVKLLFYVESADLVEGQSVKLLLADNAELTDVAVLSPIGKTTVGEGEEAATYDVFASEEIAPAAIRAAVYAAAVVVDSDGTVVSESEILEYSVFEYCMDRYDAAPTADQKALYTALLDFSASVQTVLGYTDETIDQVGGWANAYYGVKINTVIDDEVVSVDKHYFTAAEIGAVEEIPVEKFYTAGGGIARFTDVVADRGFDAVAAGSSVSVKVRGKVGFSSCNILYAAGGNYSNFEGVTSHPSFITSNKFTANPQTASGTWEGYVTETLEDGTTNTFLRISDAKSSNVVRIGDATAAAEATKVVIEFKMRFASVEKDVSDNMLFIKFGDASGKSDVASGANAYFAYGDYSSNAAGTKAGAHNVGEWYDMTIELVKSEDGTFWTSYRYINGEAVGGGYKISAAVVTGIKFEPRGKYNVVIDLDDVYLGIE